MDSRKSVCGCRTRRRDAVSRSDPDNAVISRRRCRGGGARVPLRCIGKAGIYAEAAAGSGVGARSSALAGTDRCSGGLDVEPIESHGPPTVSRPTREYSFLSEVAMASRPSTRVLSPQVTEPSIGPRKKIDRSLKHPRPERRIVGSGTCGRLQRGDAF
jgi:hypothetical protein